MSRYCLDMNTNVKISTFCRRLEPLYAAKKLTFPSQNGKKRGKCELVIMRDTQHHSGEERERSKEKKTILQHKETSTLKSNFDEETRNKASERDDSQLCSSTQTQRRSHSNRNGFPKSRRDELYPEVQTSSRTMVLLQTEEGGCCVSTPYVKRLVTLPRFTNSTYGNRPHRHCACAAYDLSHS